MMAFAITSGPFLLTRECRTMVKRGGSHHKTVNLLVVAGSLSGKPATTEKIRFGFDKTMFRGGAYWQIRRRATYQRAA
jgi:hypothetical protein